MTCQSWFARLPPYHTGSRKTPAPAHMMTQERTVRQRTCRVFIIAQNTAALLNWQLTSTRTSCGSCCAQISRKGTHCIRGGADKSLARPISRCHRTGSIVSSERGVCSYAKLQVFPCYILKEKRCRKVIKGVLFLHDNAPAHQALGTQKKLAFQFYKPPITVIKIHFFFLWRCDPTRVTASSFWGFLDHKERCTTVGRTPLDEWSARRRDLYLTTHDTHNRQISMPPVGFEPHDLSRRAAADLCLRPCGHWDWQLRYIS